MSYFEYHTTAARSYSSRFVALFMRSAYDPIDLETLEGSVSPITPPASSACRGHAGRDDLRAAPETGLPDLCLGGSVASTASPARESSPNRGSSACSSLGPGDAGCASGPRSRRSCTGQSRSRRPDHPFWGPRWTARSWRAPREDGQHVEQLDDTALIERIADELAAGRVVGWMDGASEFGPRALGHRSILAAPHAIETRDRLNREIKYREEFRPFAPVTPIESADRFFELPPGGARLGRYMSGVFRVRPEWRSAWPRSRTSTAPPASDARAADGAAAVRPARGLRTSTGFGAAQRLLVAGEPIVTRALIPRRSFSGIDILVATHICKRSASGTKQGLGVGIRGLGRGSMINAAPCSAG
jgi:carbamoyltransferase